MYAKDYNLFLKVALRWYFIHLPSIKMLTQNQPLILDSMLVQLTENISLIQSLLPITVSSWIFLNMPLEESLLFAPNCLEVHL